jgi:membrane fusion protein, copper/silver efflux system
MGHIRTILALAFAVGAGALAGYWYAARDVVVPVPSLNAAAAEDRKILYYRDPSGAPFWSATPKRDAAGREYLPVHDDEEPSFDSAPKQKTASTSGTRKVLYYRNPMGLPDTSPVPKKDPMGMNYIPVYEGEDEGDGTVKVSLDKVQRSGVRTEQVQTRVLMQAVRAAGTVKIDERRLTTVTLRSDGYVEDLFVNATGQSVRAGEPLFRVYSPEIQRAQIDLLVAMRSQGPQSLGPSGIEGAMQRLRNLGVPESRIKEVRATGGNPRMIDWPSPATGTVISKRIINGQRVMAGDELYRIADLSSVWVIADVAEADLSSIRVGMRATVTFRAYQAQPVEGDVTFIYPELKPETRTARVRIEVPNPDGLLRADMYADVVFRAGADEAPVVAVPESSVIDSGTRQIVLIARGQGRFEPRPVKLGRRGDGYAEALEGVKPGEEVVTMATFLIDAESNLRAALKAFTEQEGAR